MGKFSGNSNAKRIPPPACCPIDYEHVTFLYLPNKSGGKDLISPMPNDKVNVDPDFTDGGQAEEAVVKTYTDMSAISCGCR